MKRKFTHILLFPCLLGFQAGISQTLPPPQQWDKAFGGQGLDQLTGLQVTSDGGFITGGYSESDAGGEKSENSRGSFDYWIIKTDGSGNKQWDKTFGGSGDDKLFSVQPTPDGGFILGGTSASGISGEKSQNSRGGYDYWVIKTDAQGNKQWDKTFGGSEYEELRTLSVTTDGGYILGGYSSSGIGGDKSENSRGSEDYWIVKLDQNGNKQWDRTFGGSNAERQNVIRQTTDGGYILGGWSASNISGDKSENGQGGNDFWVVKIDASGNKQWDKTFGSNGDDNLSALQFTPDGGYVFTGPSNGTKVGDKSERSRGSFDYWVVKVDASGNKLWDKTIGGSDWDDSRGIHLTDDGGYIIGGLSTSGKSSEKSEYSRGASDYWVIKIDSTGKKQWDKTFGGRKDDALLAFQPTSDNGYILGGWSASDKSGEKSENSRGSSDFWLIKIGCAGHVYYADKDGDGYGILSDRIVECSSIPPAGYVERRGDCDDNNPDVHPGTPEICGNGIDDNCNGIIDELCDADSTIKIMIEDKLIMEGDKSLRAVRFAILLSKMSDKQVSVDFNTEDGTAVAGGDYLASGFTVLIPPNKRKVYVEIGIIGDQVPESDESFTIRLSNPKNATILKETGTVTIIDDDAPGFAGKSKERMQSPGIDKRIIKIVPNPAQSRVNFELAGFSGKVKLELSRMEGQVLKTENISVPKSGSAHHQMDISNLNAGTYLITATDERGHRKMDKLVVIK